MITTVENHENLNPTNLQKLLTHPNLIKRLAIQLVANQVDIAINMAADGCYDEQIGTFGEAAAILRDAKSVTEDYVEDLLADFRESLYEQLRLVTIDVKAVKLSADGFCDADVEVR